MVKFVHGGLSQKERDKRIHALRTHTGPGVLACTIDTTSTGLDLSFASVAVFGELTWEFQDLSQAESRTYKFGVDSKSLIQYVIARGTGDELILRGIINKLDTSERAGVASGDAMKEDLSAKKEGGMARLYAALAEMQKAATPKVRTRKMGRAK
jgi:SNF2 family DNA or RNA helicase